MDPDKDKDPIAYLLLMLSAFSKIASFIRETSFDLFSKDDMAQSAVIMQLQVIGELAKKVPEDLKKSIDIPWKNITGLRDVVSHDYFSLDLESIWQTASEAAPEVAEKIQNYINNVTITP